MPNKSALEKTIISPNLLPKEAKEELLYQTIAATITKVAQTTIVILLVLWAIGGIFILWTNQREKSLNGSLQTDSNKDKLKELEQVNEQLRDLHVLNSKIDKSIKKQYLFSGVLGELPQLAPQGVALTGFDTLTDQPGWIKIKGVAKTRDQFLTFKDGVEKSAFYAKVDSPLSNYVTPESLSFELNVQLKGWNPVWGDAIKKKSKARTSTSDDTSGE